MAAEDIDADDEPEPDVDEALARRLVAEQFPDRAGLAVRSVRSTGTDHRIFRLGDDLCLRFPRDRPVVAQLEKEARWLPGLAPHLPLGVPVPAALGDPGRGYPWRWSVCSWVHGEAMGRDGPEDGADAAERLAGFVAALQSLPAAGAPGPGPHNFSRGVAHRERDRRVRDSVRALAGEIDAAVALAVWDAALAAPEWRGEAVWIHGDLLPGNLIEREGRLAGVIDFGGLAAADPACDLLVAWSTLDTGTRPIFRRALGRAAGADRVDGAAWDRGRGWALSVAVVALAYRPLLSPEFEAVCDRMLAEVLAEG